MDALEELGYDKAKLEASLADAAVGLAPRLFAIYGVYRKGELSCFLGWGMDFGGDWGALLYCPDDNTTWKSSSAEQIRALKQVSGEAKLHWLTEWPETS